MSTFVTIVDDLSILSEGLNDGNMMYKHMIQS
jgi:hypothetical protein